MFKKIVKKLFGAAPVETPKSVLTAEKSDEAAAFRVAARQAREAERERQRTNYLNGNGVAYELWQDFQGAWRANGRVGIQPQKDFGDVCSLDNPGMGVTVYLEGYRVFIRCASREVVKVTLREVVVKEYDSLEKGVEYVRDVIGHDLFGHRVGRYQRPPVSPR